MSDVWHKCCRKRSFLCALPFILVFICVISLWLPASVEERPSNVQVREVRHAKFAIDFVYCWGGQAAQAGARDDRLIEASSANAHNTGVGCNEMQHSLRLLMQHAPFFNHIYVLVNGPQKLPAWIPNNTRISLVDRCSLFPDANDCPTNNTHACQAVVHRTPGLQEHFVYLEDDFFIVRPITPFDLFTHKGAPLILNPFCADILTHMYKKPVSELVGPDLPPSKVPSFCRRVHAPIPLRKSFTLKVEEEFSAWFAFVRSHKTRFTCCNSSIHTSYGGAGTSASEDLIGVWSQMLQQRSSGVLKPIPGPGDPYCECGSIHCIWTKTYWRVGKFLCIQNCKPHQWQRVASFLDKQWQTVLAFGVEVLWDELLRFFFSGEGALVAFVFSTCVFQSQTKRHRKG